MIGTANDLSYRYTHLGNSTKVIQEIAEGKHPFANRLKAAKLPMILVGSNVLERQDGEGLYEHLKKISANSSVVSKEQGWNGFNVLHKVFGGN
jgi:hypothetical protein